jgi:hypothetical protein
VFDDDVPLVDVDDAVALGRMFVPPGARRKWFDSERTARYSSSARSIRSAHAITPHSQRTLIRSPAGVLSSKTFSLTARKKSWFSVYG